jgi:hypothetical protein
MPTLPEIKAVYKGGEAMPVFGSDAYKQAQALATQSTGTKLPANPTPVKKTEPKNSGFDLSSLISMSKPAVNANDIKNQVKSQFSGIKSSISGSFGSKINAAKESAAAENRTLQGTLGTGRRFSTSAQAFIKFADTENNKKVAELEVAMESALANADFEMANMINNRIDKANQEARQSFQDMFQILEYAEKKEKENKDLQAPLIQSSRDSAVADLITQGITDPTQMMDLLNFTEDGLPTGGGFTAEEVSKAIGYLIPKTKEPANLGADYNTFEMAKKQGWISSDATIFDYWRKETAAKKSPAADSVGYGAGSGSDFEQFSKEQIAMSVIPPTLRNSNVELERFLKGIRAGLSEGRTPYEIADNLTGYMINEKSEFSEGMRKYMSLADLNATQIPELARLINSGQDDKAIALIENQVYAKIQNQQGDKYVSESDVIYVKNKADEITELLGEGWANEVGAFTGTFGSFLSRKFGFGQAVQIKSKITSLTADLVNKRAGSALTDSEWDRLVAPNIPSVNDNARTFKTKLQELVDDPLTRLNSERSQYELPVLNVEQVLDRKLRVPGYSSSAFKDPMNLGNITNTADPLNLGI